MAGKRKIDKVRASRDGHEFHEAWTARKAMQLLWPDSDLTALAIEGPSPADEVGASAATVEVADVTLYYGGSPTFEWINGVRDEFSRDGSGRLSLTPFICTELWLLDREQT
jgi:hypothetical protein